MRKVSSYHLSHLEEREMICALRKIAQKNDKFRGWCKKKEKKKEKRKEEWPNLASVWIPIKNENYFTI